jgi:restriction system protein
LIKLIFLWNEKKRLARSGVNEIDQMNGKTFEKYLEVLFKKLGYQVERTRYVGDYGADLVVRKNGIKTIIQAKRYKKNVGIKAVQEAVAAKGYYDCDEAMVVTNSFYTKQAIELAKANHVKLWDRNDLVKALLSVKGEKGEVATTVINHATEISAATDQTPQKEEAFNNTCVICGEVVSEKVRKYCLDNAERFGGKVYCFQHQKGVKR